MTANDTHPEAQRTILVVTHYFAAHGGGIEHVAASLIEEISNLGSFSFIWAASDCDTKPDAQNCTPLPMRTTNFIENTLGFPWPIWWPGSLKRLKHAIADANIIWLHDTLYLGNILAFLWARKNRKQVVITQHIGPIPYRNPILRGIMKLADKFITVPMLKSANQVTFISDRIAEDYYSRVPFSKPLAVIPNGVDLQKFYPPKQNNRLFLRQQFVLKPDQPVFLFVGRFVDRKGLAVIRRLASLLPGCRFWLAGHGSIDPASWLLPNVHVFNGRSGASLVELYHASDLLISPGYGEGFPLVVQEAITCGLPVLCSPETAAGCRSVQPQLHTAEVWPSNPRRTALAWARKLKSFPLPLPLKSPIYELSDFAEANWFWHPIAIAYSDIFYGLLGSK